MSEKELHIYTRVSTRAQEIEGTSLSTQKKLGEQVAAKLKLNPVIHNEGAKSSNHEEIDKRPLLQRLLLGIEEGTVQHLYAYNIDRLSRKDIVQSQIRYQLSKNNVLFYSGNDSNPTDLNNPQDKLFFQIHSAISEYDNSVRTARSRLGKIEQVKKGQWHGGPPPLGYSVSEKRLIVNDNEAKWVKTIYEMYAEGETVQDIRRHLFKKNVKTRRGKTAFSGRSIELILHNNTHYQGYYVIEMEGEDPIRVPCPKIVNRPLVKKVQKQYEKRRYKKDGTQRAKNPTQKTETLLREVMRCGHCSGRFGSNVRPDKFIAHYHCVSSQRKYRDIETNELKCDSPRNSIKIAETDKAVVDAIVDVLQKSNLFKEEVKRAVLGKKRSLQVNVDHQAKLQRQIKKVRKEIEQVEEQISALNVEKLIGVKSSKAVKEIISGVEQYRTDQEDKLAQLEQDLERTKGETLWVDWLKEFGDRLDSVIDGNTPLADKKRFVEGVVDHITVSFLDKQTASLDITLNYPYIGDRLVYVDPKNRRKGYEVRGGDRNLALEFAASYGNKGKK